MYVYLYGYKDVCLAQAVSPSTAGTGFLRPNKEPKNPEPPTGSTVGSVSRRTDTPKLLTSVTPTYTYELLCSLLMP
jgi:hypothetical protein